MIKIELVGPLSILTGGEKTVRIMHAETVLEAVQHLTKIYPEMNEKCFNEKTLSKRIIIYVDDTDIRLLQGDFTVLAPESRIKIFPALTGG
jgi:molybdopterin converting factor small subunit